jgi:hypothetical protein
MDLVNGQKQMAGQIGELTTGVHTLQQQSELIFDRLNKPEEYCSAYKNLQYRIQNLEIKKIGTAEKKSTVRPAIAGTAAASVTFAILETIQSWIETRMWK